MPVSGPVPGDASQSQTRAVEPVYWPEVLRRVYRAILFDWDGTAVEDRKSSASRLIRAMEQTLQDGVLLVIITGTKLEHLENQALRFLSPEAKRRLFVCTNRGSEVYGYNPGPELIFKRDATSEEDAALDAAAEAFKDFLHRNFGLESRIIRNRLNRRKIDLIPVPEWEDPKKSQFSDLLNAVQKRLTQARVFGGLQALVRQAMQVSKTVGLTDPKITSDVKHIEIGLTDKSDSAAWIKSHLLQEYGIPLQDVVLAGDEFGEVGGLPGSDSLIGARLNGAALISVGKEPNGAGAGVHDLHGGAARFLDFLNFQTQLRKQSARPLPPLWKRQSPTPDPAWCVEQEGFDPSREREMESIFAIGNGYLGVRGSLDSPIPISQPDLLIAGIYDRKALHRPYSELEFLTPKRGDHPYSELVALPSPFRFNLSLGGQLLSAVSREWPEWNEHVRSLDLKKGMFFESTDFSDELGRIIRVRTFRCASTEDPHLLFHGIDIESDHDQGTLEIELLPVPENFRSLYPHLTRLNREKEEDNGVLLHFRTQASKFEIVIGARTSQDGQEIHGRKWRVELKGDRPIRIRRMICALTTRDSDRVRQRVKERLSGCDWNELDSHLAVHESRWQKMWKAADIVLEGNPGLTETQRFNSYHLLIAAPRSADTSIGARTLSGRGYEGHVFWDTEIFMLPFYLNAMPQAARNILLYRYQTLPAARIRARKMQCNGACFAWESTVTGDDVTPDRILLRSSQKEIPIFTGEQQIHVTADVAFGVWRYWSATHDEPFLLQAGMEILIETARFWSSRASSRNGALHILKVIGPDEYHHSVDDNAYTNWMARLNLELAVDLSRHVKTLDRQGWKRLASRLSVTEREIEQWRAVAREIYVPAPNRDGVIEQFEGFFDLEGYPLSGQEQFRAPIDRLFDWEKINRRQIIKQADVLMLPFLFRDRFTRRQLLANYRYYEPMTDHGSSLSPSVHATLAAWLGDRVDFQKYYRQSVELDLFNLMRNSALGMHAANMGGAWQALVYGALGVRPGEEPAPVDADRFFDLMRDCEGIRIQLKFRGKNYPIHRSANGVR